MDLVRFTARLMLTWIFLQAGRDVLRNPEPRAAVAAPTIGAIRSVVPVLPADDVAVVRMNATVQILASLLFVLGRLPFLSALILAASLVPTTIGGHPFWNETDPARRSQQQTHFNKNLAILGGLLFAAADTRRHTHRS